MGPPTASRHPVGLAIRGYRGPAGLRYVLKGAGAPRPTSGRRSRTRVKREPADKPGSVVDSHSSGTHVTVCLMRPTREHPRAAGRGTRPHAPLFGLAPGGVYPAVACCHRRGALLPHLFNLTARLRGVGGVFSVALSVGSRPPGITWHPALWSPDFPPPVPEQGPVRGATVWPTPAIESSRGEGALA